MRLWAKAVPFCDNEIIGFCRRRRAARRQNVSLRSEIAQYSYMKVSAAGASAISHLVSISKYLCSMDNVCEMLFDVIVSFKKRMLRIKVMRRNRNNLAPATLLAGIA